MTGKRTPRKSIRTKTPRPKTASPFTRAQRQAMKEANEKALKKAGTEFSAIARFWAGKEGQKWEHKLRTERNWQRTLLLPTSRATYPITRGELGKILGKIIARERARKKNAHPKSESQKDAPVQHTPKPRAPFEEIDNGKWIDIFGSSDAEARAMRARGGMSLNPPPRKPKESGSASPKPGSSDLDIENGAFSKLPPARVGSRQPRTSADASMERAIDARNRALGPKGIRLGKFDRKKARVDAKINTQKEKLERLRIKRARAEVGKQYAKSRMWGLRQAWTKYWTARANRLDKRIARTEARINALIALSANVEAQHNQKRTEYMRRFATPQEAGKKALEREKRFMQQNMGEQHSRFARDMSALKQNRLVFLEMKDQEPKTEERINRVESRIRRINTSSHAIRFEIYYRMMMEAIRQGNYSEALGWLAELDKATQY